MRHVFRYIVAACFWIAILATVHLFRWSLYEPNRTSLKQLLIPESSTQHPQERTNIFFLKTHKCASSTLQNILMRFGLERGLTFVLPSVHNYIGYPEPFSPELIDEQYATANGKYNVFAHHSRYHSEGVRRVMYSDAAYITILRHPADLYESIFSYYMFQQVYNVTLEDLLKTPESLNKINGRYFNRIGFNQMSFDLGFQEDNFNNTLKIKEFIQKINKEFDLVMMFEWMEASLVLMADLMNWPLDNVISLRLNSRNLDSIYKMSNIERKKAIDLNSVDYQLYTFFLKKFTDKVIEYGKERMKHSIEKLLTLNLKLDFKCVKGIDAGGKEHTQSYILRKESDWLCFSATQDELTFTEDLRRVQRRRMAVLRRLDSLLNATTYGDSM